MDTERELSTLVSWDLVERYLANEVTADERATIETALAARSSAERVLQGFQATIHGLAARPDTAEMERGLQSLHASYASRPREKVGGFEAPSVPRRRSLGTQALLGAVATLCVVFGVFVSRNIETSATKQRFQTAPGQQSTVRLADGSTMILAPATSVTVTPSVVEVTGEAYFAVIPNATRPFVVRTANAVIRVLGTRFEVRQFADEPVSRVVVEDGRVALRSLGRGVRHDASRGMAVVSAGMLAAVSDSGVTLTSGVATQELTGWARGTLVFDGVPLREVVAEVGRVYGANVRVADSVLAAARVVVELNVLNRSIGQVLNLLGEAMSAHYVEDHGAFVLIPGRTTRHDVIEKLPDRQLPQPERQYGR